MQEAVLTEDTIVDVADALMLDDIIFLQKIREEITEAEAALAAYDPAKEALVADQEERDAAEEQQQEAAAEPGLDFTPSLSGTQTLSLDSSGDWRSAGLTSEIPLPLQGMRELPPPPKPTASFYERFLRGKRDTVEAQKEMEKLRWIVSRREAAAAAPFPDLTVCLKKLVEVMVARDLGMVEEIHRKHDEDGEEEEEEKKKIPFRKRVTRFGYYFGVRKHQDFFLKYA
jgi:hypothetical protein